MSELTKKPHTNDDYVELRFTGPKEKQEEAVRIMRELGYTDISESVPWRDAFLELEQEPSYSITLRGARTKENISQAELAEKTGIPQSHISQMENGKLEIGKERAKRLGEVLNLDYRLFL
jgi:ribosome-binding protein aMBF1 (putative translation factor)